MTIYMPLKLRHIQEYLVKQMPQSFHLKFREPKDYGQNDNRSRYRAWSFDIDSRAQKSAEERGF